MATLPLLGTKVDGALSRVRVGSDGGLLAAHARSSTSWLRQTPVQAAEGTPTLATGINCAAKGWLLLDLAVSCAAGDATCEFIILVKNLSGTGYVPIFESGTKLGGSMSQALDGNSMQFRFYVGDCDDVNIQIVAVGGTYTTGEGWTAKAAAEN